MVNIRGAQRKSKEDLAIGGLAYVLLALVAVAAVFPLLFVLSVSLTPYIEVIKNGGFILLPKSFTLEAYRSMLSEPAIPRAFGVTVTVTAVGTLINLVLTALLAYPLSRKYLPGRRFFLLYVVFTLIFSGGLIPTYLAVKMTGLLDSIWALIIPTAVWSFNVLIVKSFFEHLPEELFESARMDGAQEFRIVWQIALPLSAPVMVTVGLFYAVGHWNQFFQAVMYITDQKLYPLQLVVRNILLMTQEPLREATDVVPTVTLQMAAVVVASVPIIMVYPFLQRHFVKGMLLGSVKG
ncbi:carbohydrate ABC transporter permease [Paenibacillus thalictri]|uniref:Carbohydrate ABC transporter permease n=1 Tax=Paenibacillus thalictri TaxID=2527873 RepID=A0A4Q9DJX4_9BACL|nr:carbohydrate ABC transporter permease [Paenibacillus thalictri]TBL74664.1 carbohydrate ABC transporter permease [Paenibacillus thalictri]